MFSPPQQQPTKIYQRRKTCFCCEYHMQWLFGIFSSKKKNKQDNLWRVHSLSLTFDVVATYPPPPPQNLTFKWKWERRQKQKSGGTFARLNSMIMGKLIGMATKAVMIPIRMDSPDISIMLRFSACRWLGMIKNIKSIKEKFRCWHNTLLSFFWKYVLIAIFNKTMSLSGNIKF